MKNLFFLIAIFCTSALSPLYATVYTTVGDGNMSATSIWSPSKPSSPLASGDEIIINSDVVFNIDFTVYGKMTINSGASLVGNKKLKIGEGSTTGELINNGTIDIKELKVKGDDTVQNLTAPSITNNADITADKMHVGDNSAAGILINNIGSNIVVNGEFHLDNIVLNMAEITVTGTFKVHGGTVDGGGEITTSTLEFDDNNSRPGTMNSQNICADFSSSTEPSFEIKDGSTYSSLSALISGETASGTHHLIDEDDFYVCGFNSSGSPLPVELTDFSVAKRNDRSVLLSWTTESELNSNLFEIERSSDGSYYRTIGQVQAAGTTDEIQNYTFVDKFPLPIAYYRLKQIDFDGSLFFSESLVVEMNFENEKRLKIYPTLTKNEVNVIYKSAGNSIFTIQIYSLLGVLMFEQTYQGDDQSFYGSIDVSTYSRGHYSLVVFNTSKIASSSFVVEKE